MDWNPILVVHVHDFISCQCNIWSIAHGFFQCCQDLVVDVFCHLLVNRVIPTFVWIFLQFQKIKESFEVFVISHKFTFVQQQKNGIKLDQLPLVLWNHTKLKIYSITKGCFIVAYWISYFAYIHFASITTCPSFVFFFATYFYSEYHFGTSSYSILDILEHTMHFTIVRMPTSLK